ncbi:hypothetical protein PHYPSEUDO_010115 [Phytophthora pseudosyringae]|uniref:BZIP domain-containing protein n=1 Tax=Phytophthora pseudosyringae TaxID=221518 RepID=A0A8T1VBJ8_9STRA|nr:hypothetical protein PHYPSEUDO_010115 [Phytophthora pseudosyringae]
MRPDARLRPENAPAPAAMSSWAAAKNPSPSTSTSPSSGEDTPAGSSDAPPSGISSMWLNWKDPHAVMELCAESESGSALEMRRQKNRESMRRSRQRQRDQLQLLRDAVAELELQYKALRLQSDSSDERRLATGASSRRYAEAVELSKQLGAENLYLKASIQYQASWKLELRRVMETTVALDEFTASASAPPSPFPFKLELLNAQEAESVFGFHPLSERDVKDVILQNSRSIKRVQHQLLLGGGASQASSNSDSADDEVADEVLGPIDRSELFGWDLRRRVRGNDMEFVFTKRFKQLSVSEVMQKAWVNEMHLKGAQMVKYDVQRLEMLQEVNSNAYVLGRDVCSPDEKPVFRTTLLRYRMETTGDVPPNNASLRLLADDERALGSNLRAAGFVIGTQSLNPAANSGAKLLPERAGIEPSARLEWAELAHSIEMLQVSDRVTGEDEYVQVRWAGKNNYGSPFDAHRNAADMVTTLMRWELGTIAPAIQLIPNSDDAAPTNSHQQTPSSP